MALDAIGHIGRLFKVGQRFVDRGRIARAGLNLVFKNDITDAHARIGIRRIIGGGRVAPAVASQRCHKDCRRDGACAGEQNFAAKRERRRFLGGLFHGRGCHPFGICIFGIRRGFIAGLGKDLADTKRIEIAVESW
ncbi:MAG: hypothetical protein IPK83_11315 [Planctomycetes bacterium]|nr:hypothetical protein [Planctomycetota bacterium]